MGKGRKRRRRLRVGRVAYYDHHGTWWLSYQDGNKTVRRRVAATEDEAAIIAAQVNAQLAASVPTMFSFKAVSVAELQRQFIEYHEHVQRSSLATVGRYRTATQHLVNFGQSMPAHEIDAEAFVR